ncbi:SCY1-like protein 2 isoform X2 [Brevipalpus obovatus]
MIVDVLKRGFKQLEKYQQHCQILQIYHPLEETFDSIAFASEPVFGSLANIFAYLQDKLKQDIPATLREYTFLEFEVKYGLLQITEGLFHLHYSSNIIHHNICPQSVIINKKGTWKLSGFEFTIKCTQGDIMSPVPCLPFTSKIPKVVQPDLNYSAPECQLSSICSPQSDMFSFGLLICSLFNNGRSLLDCNLSTSLYAKQLEMIQQNVSEITTKMGQNNQIIDHLPSLLDIDPQRRANSQIFSMIKYFSDPGVNALQYLDLIHTKDTLHKSNFYNSLKNVVPNIPKKIWFQHIIPSLVVELEGNDVPATVLQPILYIIEESAPEEYHEIILPHIRSVFSIAKSVQARVCLLENIAIFAEKGPSDEVKNSVLPFVYTGFESTNPQIQSAGLRSIPKIVDFIDDYSNVKVIVQRIKIVLENPYLDYQVQADALDCVEKLLDKLDKTEILDEVLPVLAKTKLNNSSLAMPVARMYKQMLSDKRFGLTVNLLATKVMPSMLPVVVNPGLDMDEFNFLSELLQEMLDQITKNQRNKIKSEKTVSSPQTDKVPIEINFNQPTNPLYPQRPPTLKLDNRRQSLSVEELSLSDPSSPEPGQGNNLLSVSSNNNNLTLRRHSDNAINIPKIEIALSSPTTAENRNIARASSTTNLTGRRHSSISPSDAQNLNHRRHSSINLQDLQQFNRRRHSSINTHDIKRVANKMSRAADDMFCSAVDSLESKASHLKIDFNPVPLISPTKSGRRSSVAALFGHTSPTPSLFGQAQTKTSSKLLTKFGCKKAKTPTSSEKLLNSLGSGMQHFLGK